MNFLDFIHRQKELLTLLSFGKDQSTDDDAISISHFTFKSGPVSLCPESTAYSQLLDASIPENYSFSYPVFLPPGCHKASGCILLLHGLNERSWEKYLCWAEHMASQTGKAVLMFPLAFHINRAPKWWSDPRSTRSLIEKRKAETGNDRSLCFANVALSERLSQDPARFYVSGRQTVTDIVLLLNQIRNGEHPLFQQDATVDIFAYSIGSFLAEILLMANPENLFGSSRLFIFCGGSIFKNMYGESRCIMDKPAYDALFSYYCNEWLRQIRLSVDEGKVTDDAVLRAFNAMILPEEYQEERFSFFRSRKDSIAGISLQKDSVMPYNGVEACMGHQLAGECFQQLDFPYEYTHESPFPGNGRINEALLNTCFNRVFNQASSFLS